MQIFTQKTRANSFSPPTPRPQHHIFAKWELTIALREFFHQYRQLTPRPLNESLICPNCNVFADSQSVIRSIQDTSILMSTMNLQCFRYLTASKQHYKTAKIVPKELLITISKVFLSNYQDFLVNKYDRHPKFAQNGLFLNNVTI